MANATNPIFPRVLRLAAGNLTAFFVGLLAVCAALNAQIPTMHVLGITDKLDELRAHRGEVDTIFIGSSRVYHAFDPAQFDRELAERGGSARSFNFGIDGMRPPESFYVLRNVLALGLPLRRIFIEFGPINPKVNAANIGTARYIHWHDLRHTMLVLREIVDSQETRRVKCEQAAAHAACFFARLSNLGQGSEGLVFLLRGYQKVWHPALPWEGHAGFEAKTSPVLGGVRRANFEAAVTIAGRAGLQHTAVSPLLGEAVRAIIAEVRAAGAEPVLVITPTVVGRENLADLAAAGIDAPLIAFTDPRRHPALFRAENHCDEEHLNAKGAAEFTRALAEEVAPLR